MLRPASQSLERSVIFVPAGTVHRQREAIAAGAALRQARGMAERFRSYSEFWPHYLRAHRDPRSRAAHYVGTSAGVALLLVGAARRDWRCLVAAPVIGYAAA